VRGALVLLLTAVAVVAVGLDDGSYALVSRETLLPAVWLLVATGLLLGPRTRLNGVVLVPPVLLAAFAVWTAASLGWASGAERTVIEVERVVLLLGVLLLPLVLLARRDVRFAAAGIGAGVTAVAAVAMAPRLFPDETGHEVGDVLVGGPRLSDPVGYWNGLGILVALGLVILLAEAGRPGEAWRRSLAAAPIPMLACVIYLTSSRSAVAAGAVALIALVALSPYRWALAAASIVCGAAAAAALVALTRYDAFVNAPNTEKAAGQGPAFALVLVITTGVLAGAVAAGARVRKPRWADRRAGWAAVGAIALLLVVGVGFSSPAERFAAFREPPATFSVPRED
jgi:hypothetical protein